MHVDDGLLEPRRIAGGGSETAHVLVEHQLFGLHVVEARRRGHFHRALIHPQASDLVKTIFDIIRQINKDGTTILLVEQNVHHALRMAQRAYVLENGEIVMHGPAQELMQNDHVCRAYLGL